MPACFDELTLSPVSRAPQSFPPTHVTCCMRLSFASMFDAVSANGSRTPLRASEHGLLFRQVRRGCGPAFWFACGGGAYTPTSSLALVKVSAGVGLLSEPVFVIAQTKSC